ncbi:TPA: hypothetical protein DCQ22_03805 [Candidatus Nomurabacteria bacterium]|nr:hypothetical protein [Candidatus Nomurabacteria bacterium]HBY20740.1 hypothetical protein [Clostridiales bacterium]
MKPNLFRSRKFWIAVSDAIFSIVTMLLTFLLSDQTEIRVLVLGVLATLQPIFIAVINGIATEDAAKITAGSS